MGLQEGGLLLCCQVAAARVAECALPHPRPRASLLPALRTPPPPAPALPGDLACARPCLLLCPSLCSRNSSPGPCCCPCWACLWRAQGLPLLTAQPIPVRFGHCPRLQLQDGLLSPNGQITCHLMDMSHCPLPSIWWTDCKLLPIRPALTLPFQAPAQTICGLTAALSLSGLTWEVPGLPKAHGH